MSKSRPLASAQSQHQVALEPDLDLPPLSGLHVILHAGLARGVFAVPDGHRLVVSNHAGRAQDVAYRLKRVLRAQL